MLFLRRLALLRPPFHSVPAKIATLAFVEPQQLFRLPLNWGSGDNWTALWGRSFEEGCVYFQFAACISAFRFQNDQWPGYFVEKYTRRHARDRLRPPEESRLSGCLLAPRTNCFWHSRERLAFLTRCHALRKKKKKSNYSCRTHTQRSMDSSSFVASEIVLKRTIGCPAKLAVFVLSSAHEVIEIDAQDEWIWRLWPGFQIKIVASAAPSAWSLSWAIERWPNGRCTHDRA